MTDLTKIFSGFLDLLAKHKISYALIGGLALGYWAEERFTKDIDFTISLDLSTWTAFKQELEANKNIKIQSISQDSDSDVPYLIRVQFQNYPFDLISALTEYQQVLLSRAIEVQLLDHKIKIASPEDIIISKLIAHREQDMVDIKNLVDSADNLDNAYIEKWVKTWEVQKFWDKIKSNKS